jgi:hypothetical protein
MNTPILPGPPNLMVPLLVTLLIVLLYVGRKQAHQAVRSASLAIADGLRLASRSIRQAEERMQQRNREVLLASGAEAAAKELEREFQRVEAAVKSDLQNYPAIHRKMADLVLVLDEDYQKSSDVPPVPPDWVKAVKTISELPEVDDGLKANILQEIKKVVELQHIAAMKDYRKQSQERHLLLKKMMPHWRKLRSSLLNVDHQITNLTQRAQTIDQRISEYESMRSSPEQAVGRLTSSSLTQFVIAGLVMAIAIGGAMINFNLIALPMSEMVGGGSYIGPYKTSSVAALVIILVEAAMGLFLMESLCITRLFPLIAGLDDRQRLRLAWVAFSILLLLAGVESALAFMRDQIAMNLEAMRQTLTGVDAVTGNGSWIPMVGQMVLGFILPFALTFTAIPLESFVQSGRTLLGFLLTSALRVLAVVLRIAGHITVQLGKFINGVYDLLIFPLLWVEEKIQRRPQQVAAVANVPAMPPKGKEAKS